MAKKYYITTAIDYVNAEPHVGHAYQKIIADVLARWNKIQGKEVFFLTGTDEHGQKIANSAKNVGKTPKEFVDSIAPKFKESWNLLDVEFDRFIRTTDKDHEKKVQEFIKLMNKKGDIYKGEYSGLYCEGCEAYITEKDLVDGKCPFHPNKELKEIKENTYFFRLSKYEKKLLELYKEHPEYILPAFRRQEVVNRVKEGLKDLNITRLKENMGWGIPFPLDDKYVIYVWYEALLNYLTGIDWPNSDFKKFWPADIQLLGIDNGWFHCVIWPAMLLSLGIKPAKTILINGFLTFNGQKISKSLGNAISPRILVEKYGADSIRYFVCRNFVFGQDGDFSESAVIERHNNELANKLGNLVSRTTALAEKYGIKKTENNLLKKLKLKQIEKHIENYEIDKAISEIFSFIDVCNEYIQKKQPWETKDAKVLYELLDSIKAIAILLFPFMPNTSEKIAKTLNFKINYKQIHKPLAVSKIKKSEILFQKIENNKPQVKNVQEKVNKQEKTNNKGKLMLQETVGVLSEGIMSIIDFKDWEKIQLRVGKILKVEDIEGADKLYKLSIDLGKEKRTICAGLKEHYKKDELKNKQVIVIANLAPRMMRGIESNGMLLAAVSKEHKKVILISPEKSIEPGSQVS